MRPLSISGRLGVRSPFKRWGAVLLNILFYAVTLLPRVLRQRPSRLQAEPRRILLVRADQIGDVIMTTAVLPALRERFPDSRIDFLCGSWAEEIVRYHPCLDNVIVLDCPWWAPSGSRLAAWRSFPVRLVQVLRRLRRVRYDLLVDFRGDIRHIFFFGWLAGIPGRISSDRSGGRFLLTGWAAYEESLHEIDKSWAVLRLLGINARDRRPSIYYTLREKGTAHRTMDSCGLEPGKFLVIFNGGRSPLRRIPAATLAQAASELSRRNGLAVVLVGSRSDRILAEGVARQVREMLSEAEPPIVNLCGRLRLLEVAAMMKEAALFIGSDSSISHLAAAVGLPMVVIFGPTDPSRCAPEGAAVIYHRFPCSPCLQTRCVVTRHRNIAACMQEIKAEELIVAGSRLLTGQA